MLNSFQYRFQSLATFHFYIRQCTMYIVLIGTEKPKTLERYSNLQFGLRQRIHNNIAVGNIHSAGFFTTSVPILKALTVHTKLAAAEKE